MVSKTGVDGVGNDILSWGHQGYTEREPLLVSNGGIFEDIVQDVAIGGLRVFDILSCHGDPKNDQEVVVRGG